MLGLLAVLVAFAAAPYAIYVAGFYLLRPTGSAAAKSTDTEPVSVVLPTYNEEAIVREKLRELCELSYPADLIEVVVVDSSDDGTADEVRSFFDERAESAEPVPALTLIEEDGRRGVASAVNQAVDVAAHDVIFRTDCDSRLGDDVLEHAVANLQDDRIGAVTGRQVEVLGGSKVEEAYRDLQTRNQLLESRLDSTFIVHGPCFAFRKRYFEPIAADSLADDTEIAIAIRRQGKRVVVDPQLTFAEAGTSNIRSRRTRKDRRAMGLLQVLRRNRDLLGNYGAYGRVVVPFNWFFLAISPWVNAVLVGLFLGTVAAVTGGPGLLGVAVAGATFVTLGTRDRLGPLQSVYAVLDSQLSLLIATVRLRRETGDGTWEMDAESRSTFDES